MAKNEDNGGALILGLVTGLIAGAAVAMLYAPSSGRELREKINAKTNDLPKEFHYVLDDIRELYNKSVNYLSVVARENGQGLQSVLREQAEKLAAAVREATATVKAKLQEGSKSSSDGESQSAE